MTAPAKSKSRAFFEGIDWPTSLAENPIKWIPGLHLYRRWQVQQMFGVSRRTLIKWEQNQWLTPRHARRVKRRRITVVRRGRKLRIQTRGPIVLYYLGELQALAARLSTVPSTQPNPEPAT